MAVYKLFPIQDASLYSFYPKMNTGIDPIVEVSNYNVNYNAVPQVTRYVTKFDQSEIEDIIDNKVGGTQFSSSLKSYIATAQGIIFDTEVYIYPISGSWNNGNGTYLDSPFTTNGVSWTYRTFEGGDIWPATPTTPYVTSSYSNNIGGGNWYTGSSDPTHTNIEANQSFTPRSEKDLDVDVSDIVKVWYSSSKGIGGYTDIQNEGFIIKWEDTIEFNENDAIQPILQFFSVDTNTIYPPVLEIKWDDSVYSSSLDPINSEDIYVALDNNPGKFYKDSINRFRLNVRPDFPVRTFQTSSIYTTNYALPEDSYYAIKDLDTNEFLIDFDEEFTKISCDNTSNYFDIYMNGLEPERNYKILIKTVISGSTIIKDDSYYFKVING